MAALSLQIHPASAPGTDLYVAGLGTVGSALVRQLHALTSKRTKCPPPPVLRLVGACTTRGAVWVPDGFVPGPETERLAWDGPTDWTRILQRLELHERPLVFVDATSSPDVARFYPRLLRAGVHVVTPSKHANTFEQAYYDELIRLSDESGAHYRFETTVGAGLPVVEVIRDLRSAGDRVCAIHGCASGTLTFLFSELGRGTPFSRAVRAAVDLGYAEPDVRDDLSGEDVARKFMILARAAGVAVERSEVQVESLVPASVRNGSADDIPGQLARYDDHWRQRTERAHSSRQVLRYVGSLTDGRIRVGIRAVSTASSLGHLDGTDNLFEIYTDRYAASPIVVRGPGAGAEVTAAGVLADILKAAARTPDRRAELPALSTRTTAAAANSAVPT